MKKGLNFCEGSEAHVIVPICIEKLTTTGQWIVKIKTTVTDIDKPFIETLVSDFQVK